MEIKKTKKNIRLQKYWEPQIPKVLGSLVSEQGGCNIICSVSGFTLINQNMETLHRLHLYIAST